MQLMLDGGRTDLIQLTFCVTRIKATRDGGVRECQTIWQQHAHIVGTSREVAHLAAGAIAIER